MSNTVKDRHERFEELRQNKPAPGIILRAKVAGIMVPVYIEHRRDDNTRLMFTNALIDDECTGWYLSRDIAGLKILILPRSQEWLIRMNGGTEDKLMVKALRVVRHTDRGTALIAEVLGVG